MNEPLKAQNIFQDIIHMATTSITLNLFRFDKPSDADELNFYNRDPLNKKLSDMLNDTIMNYEEQMDTFIQNNEEEENMFILSYTKWEHSFTNSNNSDDDHCIPNLDFFNDDFSLDNSHQNELDNQSEKVDFNISSTNKVLVFEMNKNSNFNLLSPAQVSVSIMKMFLCISKLNDI